VKRLQTVGGRTSLSLDYDPEAAGLPSRLQHDGENPITAGAPLFNAFAPPQPPVFGSIPKPSSFGKRVSYQRVSGDQVVITAADEARNGHIPIKDANIPTIRRMAPPGGNVSVSIA
jgi:hypothetical protein